MSLIITTSGLLFILALAGNTASAMPVSNAATQLDRDRAYAQEAYSGVLIFNDVAGKSQNISISLAEPEVLCNFKLYILAIFITCKLHTCS